MLERRMAELEEELKVRTRSETILSWPQMLCMLLPDELRWSWSGSSALLGFNFCFSTI